MFVCQIYHLAIYAWWLDDDCKPSASSSSLPSCDVRRGAEAARCVCHRQQMREGRGSFASCGGALQEVALVDAHGYPQPVLQRPGRSTAGRRAHRSGSGSYDEPRTTAFSVLGVETEVCVWLRRGGRCAGWWCVEDGQGAVEAHSQMKSHTATDSLCASRASSPKHRVLL